MERRDFIKTTGLLGGAVALSGPAALARPNTVAADSFWLDGPMRWAQLAFVERDPGHYDPDFWLSYFKRIHADGALLSAGGVVAFYPTQIPLHHRSDFLGTNPSQHICIVSHIPIVSFCSAVFYDKNEPNGDWKISRALLHVDSRRITELFRSYKNIRCCLSGHIHMEDNVNYRGISYYCNGSICGDWWGGKFHDFDPGYAVFEFSKSGTVKREMVTYG
jgi:hypothetical protein